VWAVSSGNAISFTPNNGFTEGVDFVTGSSALQTAYKPATGAAESPSSTPSAGAGRWAFVAAVIKSSTTP